MTDTYSYDITCPACRQPITLDIPRELDAEHDAKALQTIMAGTFGETVCPHCGQSFYADHPLTVVDSPRRLLIHLTATTDPIAVQRAVDMLAARPETALDERPHMRLVFHFDDLREKLILARYGLDDRTTELMKVPLLQKMRHERPELGVVRILYFRKGADDRFLMLDAASRTLADVPFRRERHKALAAQVAQLDDPLLVNGAWALATLQKYPSLIND